MAAVGVRENVPESGTSKKNRVFNHHCRCNQLYGCDPSRSVVNTLLHKVVTGRLLWIPTFW